MSQNPEEIKFENDSEASSLLEGYRKSAVPMEKFALGVRLFELADAKGHKKQSSAILDELGNNAYTDEQRNIILVKRAEHLLRQSQYDEAVTCLEKAIVQLSQTPDSLILYNAYRNLAWIYFRQGYLERARSFTDGADMVLSMRAGKTDRETSSARASLYHILGLIESASGEQDAAIGYYDREIELLDELGESARTGSVYNNLSGIYKTKGMFAKALEFQLKSINMAESSGELLSVAISCNNLGEIYHALGKYEEAQNYYSRYLDLNRKINNTVGDAFGYSGLGRIYQSLGDFTKAEEAFVKALDVAVSVKSKGKEAGILAEMTELYLAVDQPEKAIGCLDRAIKISLEIERFNTHRHQVLNAKIIMKRGLKKDNDKTLLTKARDLLTDVLSHPVTIEDEEAISGIELEIDAWSTLALAEYRLDNIKNAGECIIKAEEKVNFISGQLDPELKESFLARKDLSEVHRRKKEIDGTG
jgi:tetratricopeptide (TPR) repeat protein